MTTPFKNNLHQKLQGILGGTDPGNKIQAQALFSLYSLFSDKPDEAIREALMHAAPGILASVEAMDNGGHKLSKDEKAELWDEIEDEMASGEGMPQPGE